MSVLLVFSTSRYFMAKKVIFSQKLWFCEICDFTAKSCDSTKTKTFFFLVLEKKVSFWQNSQSYFINEQICDFRTKVLILHLNRIFFRNLKPEHNLNTFWSVQVGSWFGLCWFRAAEITGQKSPLPNQPPTSRVRLLFPPEPRQKMIRV